MVLTVNPSSYKHSWNHRQLSGTDSTADDFESHFASSKSWRRSWTWRWLFLVSTVLSSHSCGRWGSSSTKMGIWLYLTDNNGQQRWRFEGDIWNISCISFLVWKNSGISKIGTRKTRTVPSKHATWHGVCQVKYMPPIVWRASDDHTLVIIPGRFYGIAVPRLKPPIPLQKS